MASQIVCEVCTEKVPVDKIQICSECGMEYGPCCSSEEPRLCKECDEEMEEEGDEDIDEDEDSDDGDGDDDEDEDDEDEEDEEDDDLDGDEDEQEIEIEEVPPPKRVA